MTHTHTDPKHTATQHRAAPHGAKARTKTGVLIVALGTPDAPTPKALRRYLAEFLSDPRVIEVPRPIWLPVLYGPILTFRPRKSAKAYAEIWDKERGQSPLRSITEDQCTALKARLSETYGSDVYVDWAFRYGTPSLESRIHAAVEAGVGQLVVFPLYPHYSATTTASVVDEVGRVLTRMRWQPTVRTVAPYYDRPDYIQALATRLQADMASLDFAPEKIVLSYHSIPKAYWDKGDPYPCHCFKTTRLLADAMQLPAERFISAFQSRVGPTEWVGPYSEDTVKALGAEGVKSILVAAPAFSADCVETLEEIDMGLRKSFLDAGGERFHYSACLNASREGMDVLANIARDNLAGWL